MLDVDEARDDGGFGGVVEQVVGGAGEHQAGGVLFQRRGNQRDAMQAGTRLDAQFAQTAHAVVDAGADVHDGDVRAMQAQDLAQARPVGGQLAGQAERIERGEYRLAPLCLGHQQRDAQRHDEHR